MTKKSNRKNRTKNNKNSNNVDSVNTDHDSKTNPSKISLNIFIEKDAPFLEDVLENINKLEKNNHNIKLNIYNGLTKYSFSLNLAACSENHYYQQKYRQCKCFA